jgi:3-oxoadipate enol-lactonase
MGTMIVEANGIRMNYELSGAQDAATVVLSHSLGCRLDMWEAQVPVLGDRFRVLRYDTRGHGGTEAPDGPYTMALLGEDALALLDALGIPEVHWIGLSMGGMIGQYIALNHAHRFKSMVLCDTAAAMPEENQPLWDERIRTARQHGMGALVEATMERWFTGSFLDRHPPEVDRIREQLLSTPVAGYIGCSEAIRHIDFLDGLGQVRLPTLVMVGAEDPATPVEAARAIQERIPSAGLVVLPSSAHLTNVEQSEAFNSALLQFLKA